MLLAGDDKVDSLLRIEDDANCLIADPSRTFFMKVDACIFRDKKKMCSKTSADVSK